MGRQYRTTTDKMKFEIYFYTGKGYKRAGHKIKKTSLPPLYGGVQSSGRSEHIKLAPKSPKKMYAERGTYCSGDPKRITVLHKYLNVNNEELFMKKWGAIDRKNLPKAVRCLGITIEFPGGNNILL